MNCTKCGAQNLDGAKFCAGCGSPLTAAEQPAYQQPAYQPQQPYGYDPNQPTPYAPPQQPKKPLNYKLIGIIAGVAALALILILVLGGTSNSPEGVAEAFMEAAADNDVDAVADLLYGDMKDDAEEYCPGSEMEGIEYDMTDFEVVASDKITDKDDLEYFAERYDIDGEVEEVQEMIAKVTMEVSYMGKSQEMTNEAEFTVFCVDGDWYVADMDF